MARISDLIYKDMVNKDLAYPGIYMAELMQDINGKIKVYVPSVMNRPTTVSELESLPEAVWCAYNLESCDITNAEKPMWVMFEAGDVKRPVIVSYTVVGGAGNNGISNSGSSNGSFGNMSIVSSVNTDNAVIDKAVNWAVSKANDPNVTYSYGADGPNQYDCSHFVYRAFHDGAGINLSYAATGSMPSVYTNYGFKLVNISNFNDTSQLQVGDILVSASHTAIYIGNNQIVHASTANAPTADQVKVAQYSYNNSSSRAWTSCLRYIGG